MIDTVRQPVLPQRRRPQRGFTLVELLVVMAITVILLGLIFGPILSGFNFVARAEQTADAQETARRVLQQVTRESKDAVRVSVASGDLLRLPQSDNAAVRDTGVRSLGYIYAYDNNGNAYQLNGALLDFLPPDDTLGLNDRAGGRLSSPTVPQVIQGSQHTHEAGNGRTTAAQGAHNVVVRYFVGLQDPGYPHTNEGDRWSARSGAPRWSNSHVQTDLLGGAGVDNTYVLYRIEFDPDDPAFSNWAIPDPNFSGQGAAPLVKNPNFFYDERTAPNGDPFWENWRRNAVVVTPTRNIDLVRFIRNDAGAITGAQSTVTFTPTVVQNDAAVPTSGQEGDSLTYVTKFGNWTGVQNDGSLTTTEFRPPAIGVYPHIVVYRPETRNNVTDLDRVFDNWETDRSSPAYPGNSRIVTWDSRNGAVRFGFGVPDAISFEYPLSSRDNGFDFDLLEMAQRMGKLPNIPASLRDNIRIMPESDVISLSYRRFEQHGDHPGEGELVDREVSFRRTKDPQWPDVRLPGWWNLPGNPTSGQQSPRNLPEPGSYFVDPETGHLLLGFSIDGKGAPHPIPVGAVRDDMTPSKVIFDRPVLHVRFALVSNTPEDIVKVDYGTKSLINVTMGVRMFDPSTSRPILVQLNDKIAMRNMGR
ncbi:MAG: type II secretion system GspH family protein [Armatimonadetes bacterium]|nr:type II secretion system GspH family protein [Armatimonadota bacterium]